MSNGYRTLSQHLNDLKKENFSLKLRIYFLEERMQQKYEASREDVYKRVSERVGRLACPGPVPCAQRWAGLCIPAFSSGLDKPVPPSGRLSSFFLCSWRGLGRACGSKPCGDTAGLKCSSCVYP